MASVEWERSGDRPLPTLVEAEAAQEPPVTDAAPADEERVRRTGVADPYEATVERLFALLEENQVAIAVSQRRVRSEAGTV